MQLKTFRHLWGLSQPFTVSFPALSRAGYDGVEYKIRGAEADPSFKKLLLANNLGFISQVHTQGETVNEHIASFKKLVQASVAFSPVLINCQGGKDCWGMDEKIDFIGMALQYEKEIGIPVAHEIHRGRITYTPWETRDLLLSFNTLKICCDFSHWVCVCERLLTTEADIIKLCARHCIHVHSRVGFEQGPQVPDPRAPEYAVHLEAHEEWWDIIWETQLRNNFKISTLTPEFGPPAYQHTLPFSKTPISDLAEICNWMNNRQKKRFKQFINSTQHVTTSGNHSN